MPKAAYKKAVFVYKNKKNWRGMHVSKLMGEKMVKEASVVPIGWLFEQLTKCLHNDQETIRIACDKGGDVYIETFMDGDEIDGYPGPKDIDPEGWNNDWPKINLP